ncbi:UDP-glycosyltransferase 73D1-like isoform X1 [Benincasa hispida]|uniref:UDP-glycosyltransferase 73D1-like isoform X1 n=1 Tax=Benincasa hispida TaxID=102211 RepID=UPI00190244B0|nr:UDP-glycosyltransferase 73D1-like isoform X1 [Benincasa hispida]
MAFTLCNQLEVQPHFVLVPLMAQGHMIPMIDIATLLARHGIFVTFVTTPYNASRLESFFAQAKQSSPSISLLEIPFPCLQVGLPLGCENLDALPSRGLLRNFYNALSLLQQPLEMSLDNHLLPPTCIVSDKYLYWTAQTAHKFKCPRVVFHGTGCFSLLSSHNLQIYSPHSSVHSDFQPFLVPGLPHKIEITKFQLPGSLVKSPDFEDFRDKITEAEQEAYGVVVNSFTELENGYSENYERAISKKLWCIGPVSLCNKNSSEKYSRGNRASIKQRNCLDWLDSMIPKSVLYICLGSLCRLIPSQLIQIGQSLESSTRPFIWVIKNRDENYSELERWLSEEDFEGKIKGRGLIIRGWAPQLLILLHRSIGGFLTHCGWNSTVEGISGGVPMITWPQFAEQFLNEKLVVEVLKIGVRIGVEGAVRWGEEEGVGVMVKKEEIEKAIEMVMDGGEEGEERRRRVGGLSKMAAKAMESGGSSYVNLSLFIKDVMAQSAHLKA